MGKRIDEQRRVEAQARGSAEAADTVALLVLVAAGLAILIVICGRLLQKQCRNISLCDNN